MEKPTRRNRALESLPHQPLAGPTLFGGANPTRDKSDDKPVRILAALENNARDVQRIVRPLKRMMWVGLFLLLGIGLVAFGYSGLMQRKAVDAAPLLVAEQPRAAVAAKQIIAKQDEYAPPQTATIEDVAVKDAANPGSPFAVLEPAPKLSTPPASRPVTKPKPDDPKLNQSAPPARTQQIAALVVAPPKPAAAKKAAPVKKTKDADVVLLEALVSHVDAQRRIAGEKPVLGAVALNEPETVVRALSANNEAAKRCTGLSALEGELCRVKACAGREGEADCKTAVDAFSLR